MPVINMGSNEDPNWVEVPEGTPGAIRGNASGPQNAPPPPGLEQFLTTTPPPAQVQTGTTSEGDPIFAPPPPGTQPAQQFYNSNGDPIDPLGIAGTAPWNEAVWNMYNSLQGSPMERFQQMLDQGVQIGELGNLLMQRGVVTPDDLYTNGAYVAFQQHMASREPFGSVYNPVGSGGIAAPGDPGAMFFNANNVHPALVMAGVMGAGAAFGTGAAAGSGAEGVVFGGAESGAGAGAGSGFTVDPVTGDTVLTGGGGGEGFVVDPSTGDTVLTPPPSGTPPADFVVDPNTGDTVLTPSPGGGGSGGGSQPIGVFPGEGGGGSGGDGGLPLGINPGDIIGGGLGYLGSREMAEMYERLQREYMAMGAPSRARYEASFAPGFTMANDPGYTDALNQTAKSTLHGLSVGGNPADSPNAWNQTLMDVNQRFAYPALQDYRRMGANAGGLSRFADAAPAAASAGIQARGGMWDALGYGAGSIFSQLGRS